MEENPQFASLRTAAFRNDIAAVRQQLATLKKHNPQVVQLAVNNCDSLGNTALQIAAEKGHEEIIRILVSYGALVNLQDYTYGNTALHKAAWKGFSRTLRLLTETDTCQLDLANFGGFTALHLCCQVGHNQCCRELLMGGAAVNAKNNYGDTALHTSARYGHCGVARILLSAKCRVSEINKNGDTALHISVAMGKKKLTKIFLEAGCDTKIRNKQLETAKDIVVRKDLQDILGLFKHSAKMRKKHHKASNSTAIVSPYGCHFYPNSDNFPKPNLDSLPKEPLKKGEQYYLDLGGNICKGPISLKLGCNCAPFLENLQISLENNKKELKRAQCRLNQRLCNLEHKLHNVIRQSGRFRKKAKSLENLQETIDFVPVANSNNCKSMDELSVSDEHIDNHNGKQSVKDLVKMFQNNNDDGNCSELSDDDFTPIANYYENFPPKTRTTLYIEPLEVKLSKMRVLDTDNNDSGYSTKVYGSSKGNSPNNKKMAADCPSFSLV